MQIQYVLSYLFYLNNNNKKFNNFIDIKKQFGGFQQYGVERVGEMGEEGQKVKIC